MASVLRSKLYGKLQEMSVACCRQCIYIYRICYFAVACKILIDQSTFVRAIGLVERLFFLYGSCFSITFSLLISPEPAAHSPQPTNSSGKIHHTRDSLESASASRRFCFSSRRRSPASGRRRRFFQGRQWRGAARGGLCTASGRGRRRRREAGGEELMHCRFFISLFCSNPHAVAA